MVARRETQERPAPSPANGAAPRSSLLPVLALINGSALLALVIVVLRPTALGAMQQVVTLLATWLLVNLLVVVLVRMIDSNRAGTARVDVSPRGASIAVSVDDCAGSRVVRDPVVNKR